MLKYPDAEEALANVHSKYVPDDKQDIYQQGSDALFDLRTSKPLFIHRLLNPGDRKDAEVLLEHIPVNKTPISAVC